MYRTGLIDLPFETGFLFVRLIFGTEPPIPIPETRSAFHLRARF